MVAELQLTVGGLDGMRAYSASQEAAFSANEAARYALKMATSASDAAMKAAAARRNLEYYVFGTSVSTVPPVVPPMIPKSAASYPAYPYVSSPTQWQQGSVPVTRQEVDLGYLPVIESYNFAKMAKPGIGLVPDLPPIKTTLGDSTSWSDVLQYRSQLVDARNSQLEYQQNLSELHSKIRRACKELTNRDNSVKENLETLALERGRLGYLRNELSRRAEELARRETALKEKDPNWLTEHFPKSDQSKRERDKQNAILLEVEHKKRSLSSGGPLPATTGISPEHADSASSGSSSSGPSSLYSSLLGSSDNKAQASSSTGSSPMKGENNSSGTPSLSPAPEQNEVSVSPRGFRTMVENRPQQQDPLGIPSQAAKECLDAIWDEYSTNLEDATCLDGEVFAVTSTKKLSRVMSLPNLLRLCSDGDFALSTANQIELFLETVRTGAPECRYSLVERGQFFELLKKVMQLTDSSLADSERRLVTVLFKEYLFPMYKRLLMHERVVSAKHPPLPPSTVCRPILFARRMS